MILVTSESKKKAVLKYYGEIGHYHEGRNFDYYFSQYDGKYEEIDIHLHCYGGSVFEGNLIYNRLNSAVSIVNIIVDGVAASMGSILMLAGVKRFIAENGFVMVHCPSGGVIGNASDLEANAKLLRDMEANFAAKYAEITGMSVDEVKSKWLDGNDHWLNADEAVKHGFATAKITAIVKNVKDLNTETAKTIGAESMYNRFAALLTEDIKDTQKPNLNDNKEMKKEELIARYKLTGVTAESSDTAIMEAIDAKFKNESDKATKAQDELKSIKDSEITDAVEAAVKEKKITAEQKETFVKIGKSAGIEALKAALETAKPQKTIVSTLASGAANATGAADDSIKDSWTWNKWQEEAAKDKAIEAELEKMPDADPEKFKALYKAKFGTEPGK